MFFHFQKKLFNTVWWAIYWTSRTETIYCSYRTMVNPISIPVLILILSIRLLCLPLIERQQNAGQRQRARLPFTLMANLELSINMLGSEAERPYYPERTHTSTGRTCKLLSEEPHPASGSSILRPSRKVAPFTIAPLCYLQFIGITL